MSKWVWSFGHFVRQHFKENFQRACWNLRIDGSQVELAAHLLVGLAVGGVAHGDLRELLEGNKVAELGGTGLLDGLGGFYDLGDVSDVRFLGSGAHCELCGCVLALLGGSIMGGGDGGRGLGSFFLEFREALRGAGAA
jgi:hypothetical protein